MPPALAGNLQLCDAVARKPYIDWVRQEVLPLQYTIKKGVFKHNWPGTASWNGNANDESSEATGRQGESRPEDGQQRSGTGGDGGGASGTTGGSASAVGPFDIVLMTQTSPDRCVMSQSGNMQFRAEAIAHRAPRAVAS